MQANDPATPPDTTDCASSWAQYERANLDAAPDWLGVPSSVLNAAPRAAVRDELLLAQLHEAASQHAWPMLDQSMLAYAPAALAPPGLAPLVPTEPPALQPAPPAQLFEPRPHRGSLTRPPARRDGVFALAASLLLLAIILSWAVAMEGGVVRDPLPVASSPAPSAVPAPEAPAPAS